MLKLFITFVLLMCVTEDILAGLISRSNPEPGTFPLGALRDLSVGIWFDGENVRSVTFDLNGTRIVRPCSKRDGFLDVSFSGNVWSWGSNVVYVTFQDSGGGVMSRETLTYQIVKPSEQSKPTPQSAQWRSGATPVGSWVNHYSTGASTPTWNRLTTKATFYFRADGTGTLTIVTAGYSNPDGQYNGVRGTGEWTVVKSESFTWEQIGENQFSFTVTGGRLSGEARFLTERSASVDEVGSKASFSVHGGTLTTGSGDEYGTYKRGSD